MPAGAMRDHGFEATELVLDDSGNVYLSDEDHGTLIGRVFAGTNG